jgi:ATP synthase F1 complex assembly factor 2
MFGLLVRQASRQIRANIVQADHSIKLATCNYSDYGSDASRKARKRFYKNVSVCENGKGAYEINLDKRKLKTPSGTVFNVKSEMLANMCAFEWESQTKQIKLGTMHLTSMVNTCLDNPNKLTKEAVINSLLEYVPTDTILFFDANDGLSDPNGNLLQLQEKRWRPVVNWFNHKL